MAEQTGGHISQGSADSATLTVKTCFITILRQISGSALLELEMDGRTITGTITKRYPKVARRCLGPSLAPLLAFVALFYNARVCFLATSLKLATQQWQCGSQNLHLPPAMHVPAVESLLRSHHSAGTAYSHTPYYYQSYLSETFCAAVAQREPCLSLNIKPCMSDLRMLADRDWRLRKNKQTRI